VLDDFGRLRRAWREADPEDADLDSSIGRYSAPSGLKFPDQRGLTGAVVPASCGSGSAAGRS
jgi:hypothetical protein